MAISMLKGVQNYCFPNEMESEENRLGEKRRGADRSRRPLEGQKRMCHLKDASKSNRLALPPISSCKDF